MNKNKKQKGFTLVELLIAVSILGLVSILVIPNVSTLKEKNNLSAYKKYGESLISSGKLYVDAYAEDIFGILETGCKDILFSELKGKGLVKDINIENVSCADDSAKRSFVRVRKYTDHYSYDYSLYCTKSNGEEVYKKVINGECDSSPDSTTPTIKFKPSIEYETWTSGINEYVEINISDEYGMLENTLLEYVWVNGDIKLGTPKEVAFNNKRYAGELDQPLTAKIPLPQNYTTKEMHLEVYPTQIKDANGNAISSDEIIKTNNFWLDNDGPIISFESNLNQQTWHMGTSKYINVNISDVSGLAANTQIQYAWMDGTTIIDSYKTHSFYNNKKAGTPAQPITVKIPFPTGKSSNKIHLVVKPISVKDSNNVEQTQTADTATSNSAYYWLDNTAPTVTFSQNMDVNYTGTATLVENHSGIFYARYCISTTGCVPGIEAALDANNSFEFQFDDIAEHNLYYVCVRAKDNTNNQLPATCHKYVTNITVPKLELVKFPCNKIARGTNKVIVDEVDYGTGGSGTVKCTYGNNNVTLMDNNVKNIDTLGQTTVKCTAQNTKTKNFKTVSTELTVMDVFDKSRITSKTVSSGSGLYKISDYTYRYKGGGCSVFDHNKIYGDYWNQCLTPNTDVNNYFQLRSSGAMFRIMEITSGRIKLVAQNSFKYEDNVNNSNTFTSSNVHSYLEDLYKKNLLYKLIHKENIYPNSLSQYRQTVLNTFYHNDYIFYKNNEWRGSAFDATFTLPTFTEACQYTNRSEYSQIGISPDNASTTCSVNNWFLYNNAGQSEHTKNGKKFYVSQSHAFATTATLSSNGKVLYYRDRVESVDYYKNYIRPVFYINSNLKFTGSGTYDDPYLLWDCY